MTVRGALQSLSEVQREAIELPYFGGFTQMEIADRTATPLPVAMRKYPLVAAEKYPPLD